jgi:hypothetical protein
MPNTYSKLHAQIIFAVKDDPISFRMNGEMNYINTFPEL